jgi:Permuted papain-like amidase enzyme, YaeF/YiiX, C92 family
MGPAQRHLSGPNCGQVSVGMLKSTIKFLRLFAIAGLAVIASIAVWLSATAVTAQDLPKLKSGDIVFQTSTSSQSAAIFMASSSAYTHMGIIETGANGKVSVVEAVGPVRQTALDQWIKRGLGGRITIKRDETLDDVAAQRILAAAHVYDGKPYDRFFMNGTDEIYCSELVRLAFLQGANMEVGPVQKVKELDTDNMLARNLIKKRWRSYPLCQGTNDTYESCLVKIMEQELVTPVSIANDSKFKTIFSNYGLTAQ